MSLEFLELGLNAGYELARLNGTLELYPDFWRFVTAHYKEFPREYVLNSHTRRNTTGQLEKTLVTYLIKICTYKCTITNCQLASLTMSLLGYESYLQMNHRFRQKVENFLRKERKEGGKVPPSTRSFSFYSNSYYDEYVDDESGVSSRPTTRSQTNMMNALKRNQCDNESKKEAGLQAILEKDQEKTNLSILQGDKINSIDRTNESFTIQNSPTLSNSRVC